MDHIILDGVLPGLTSTDPETIVTSVEAAIGIVQRVVDHVVMAFEENPNRFFIAERLYSFGSLIVDPLKKVLAETESLEAKTFAAILLLRFNVEDGVPWLLAQLSGENPNLCLIARALAANRISNASDKIIERLRSCNIDQVDLIVCLLASLEKLGIGLPNDLKEKFGGENVAWQIRTILDTYGKMADRA